MHSLKSVRQDTQVTHYLRGVVESFEELAASHMQQIRVDITNSRDYFQGLADLSAEVGIDLLSSPLADNDRHAAVLVSANKGLYGQLVHNIIEDFLAYATEHESDLFVLGQVGADYLRTHHPQISFTYLLMEDDDFDSASLSLLVSQLVNYSQLQIFYGQFENIARQSPVKREFTGELILSNLPKKLKEAAVKKLLYLYEPGPEQISELFSRQVFGSLVEQTIRESQLAKFASRLMHLDEVLENVDQKLNNLQNESRRIKKRLDTKKQNMLVSTIRTQSMRSSHAS